MEQFPFVFTDESGYSGSNLLDDVQPIFTFASHNFTKIESKGIMQHYFSSYAGKELKYVSMKKNSSRCKMIAEFIGYLSTLPERKVVHITHKRFCFISKIVDLFVEPFFEYQNKPFHEKNIGRAYANVIFHTLESYCDHSFKETFYTLFNKYIRVVDDDAYRDIANMLDSLVTQIKLLSPDRFHSLRVQAVSTLAVAFKARIFALDGDTTKDDLGIAYTSARMCFGKWTEKFPSGFNVRYDASKELDKNKDITLFLSEKAFQVENQQLAGYGDRKGYLLYPIRSYESTRSHDSLGIQLADIIAGVLTDTWSTIATGGDLRKSIMLSSAIKVIPDDMIYPSMEDTDIWENQASEGIHPIKGLNDYLDGFPGKI